MPALPDHWRPSDCGILVGFLNNENTRDDEIPAEYAGRPIIEFKILERDAAQSRDLAEIVGASVNAGVPTFLGVPGPPGYKGAKVFLNEAIKSAAAAAGGDTILLTLAQAMQLFEKYNFEPLL